MAHSTWLTQALAEAHYIEDVRALKHFVFHPRYNGASNLCLVCEQAAGDGQGDPDWLAGHAQGCGYAQAVARVSKNAPLKAWLDRQ